MGLDKSINLRSMPSRNFYHATRSPSWSEQPSIRVYKSTPEDVTVQIRRQKDYTTANLTVDQAEELRDALTAILSEFQVSSHERDFDVEQPERAYGE